MTVNWAWCITTLVCGWVAGFLMGAWCQAEATKDKEGRP